MSAQWKKEQPVKRRIFHCRASDPGHSSRPKSTCRCLAPLVRAGPGVAASPVLGQRRGARAPAGGHQGTFVPCFGSMHDPAAAIPLPCSLPQWQGACWQPHTSPCPPVSSLGPQASACQAVSDFTRDWCSWNCPWAGSMHASWKISCGESGLSEGNPLRLLLQRESSFRKATSWVLPSLGMASPAAQSWGSPVLVPPGC